jgi:hypothetical protein
MSPFHPLRLHHLVLLLLLHTIFTPTTAFSNLRTCTDGACLRSSRTIDMLNTFRNTTCKPLNVATGGSFQIVELDPGCAGKIYEFCLGRRG